MGRWRDFVGEAPKLGSLKAWASKYWSVVGNLHFLFLGGALILFKFENCVDAEKVWRKGCCSFDKKKG